MAGIPPSVHSKPSSSPTTPSQHPPRCFLEPHPGLCLLPLSLFATSLHPSSPSRPRLPGTRRSEAEGIQPLPLRRQDETLAAVSAIQPFAGASFCCCSASASPPPRCSDQLAITREADPLGSRSVITTSATSKGPGGSNRAAALTSPLQLRVVFRRTSHLPSSNRCEGRQLSEGFPSAP